MPDFNRPDPDHIHGYTTETHVPIFKSVAVAEAYWDAERWPNFSPREFACKGTGRVAWVPATVDKLQALRSRVGPMIVVSAYRSPEHNAALRRRGIGAARNSRHMQADAYDVSMANHNPHEYVRAANEIGFDGIGTYPPAGGNFVHVDTRGWRSRWGDPFPARQVAFSGAEEPTAPPMTPNAVRTAGGLGLGAFGAGATVLTAGGQAVGGLSETVQLVIVGAIIAGAALALIAGPARIRNWINQITGKEGDV
jgi:zinc D-Ala-D-Ala carboxypeptidase